jgi:hypothetical protein
MNRKVINKQLWIVLRKFGSNGHHHEPQVPVFHDRLGKGCLVVCFLWIMYRFKEDKGQMFGFYKPWLHEHHHEHIQYTEGGLAGDAMPLLVEHGDDEDEEDEEEEEEEEE